MIPVRCRARSFLGWKPAIVQVLGGGFWNLGVPVFFSKLMAKWRWPGSGGVESVGVSGALRYHRCQARRESSERYFPREEGPQAGGNHFQSSSPATKFSQFGTLWASGEILMWEEFGVEKKLLHVTIKCSFK